MSGRHVEVRLIGAPSHVEATFLALSRVMPVSRGSRRPVRERDGRVIQHLTLTAPDTRQEADRG